MFNAPACFPEMPGRASSPRIISSGKRFKITESMLTPETQSKSPLL